MASTDYDQYDNEYKPVASAKQIEEARDRDMNEGAERQREHDEQEARNKQVMEDFERSKQEARERRENERIEQKRDADMAMAVRPTRTKQLLAAGKKRYAERAESLAIERKRDEDMNAGASRSSLLKASLEESERVKMFQEVEEKQRERYSILDAAANAPIPKKDRKSTGGYEPLKPFNLADFGRTVAGKATSSLKSTASHHLSQSFNDVFKTPLNPRSPTNPKGALRQQKVNPIVSSILGGVAKPRGKTPTGLLDLGGFGSSPQSMLAVKPKRAAPKKRKGKAVKRVTTAKRNILDDMLFF